MTNADSMSAIFTHRLKLSPDIQYKLGCTNESSAWFEEYAGILSLPQFLDDDIQDSIIFTLLEPVKLNLPTSRLQDWSFYDYYSLRIWYQNENPNLIYQLIRNATLHDKIYSYWASVHPIYRRVVDFGGAPFHAALMEHKGSGFLLAAPGGGGKSTTARRLSETCNVITDDEILVMPNENNSYEAHPFPTWSNFFYDRNVKIWNVESKIPLKAAFFIEKCEACEIIPLKPFEASGFYNQSIRQIMSRGWSLSSGEIESDLQQKSIDAAVSIAKVIPAYKLRIDLNSDIRVLIEKCLDSI